MIYSTAPRSKPFCDWLDVTCSPEDSFVDDVRSFLDFHCCPVAFSDETSASYELGHGILKLEQKKRFHRASASGKCVSWLREQQLFRDYVNVLGSVSHKVTRLDAAVDVAVDTPIVLRDLESRFPLDLFWFGRKALRVTRLYSARLSDGQQTGTWYVGHRSSARVTCRVYDKQAELLEKQGQEITPLTRFEITFKKDYGCSLFDALMPESLFYSHSAPESSGLLGTVKGGGLLPEPDGYNAGPWSSRGTVPWVSEPFDYSMTLERFDKRVELSPEIQRLAELASQLGPDAESIILRHFKRALAAQRHVTSDDAC